MWIFTWLDDWLKPYELALKFFALVISPVLAGGAFIWNRKDRRELIAQAEELGVLKEEVRDARVDLVEKQNTIQKSQAELLNKGAEVEKLRSDLHSITEGSQELWKLRPAKPFPEYLSWLRDPAGAKTITIGNLKGGVGKTTLAANLAAYISTTRNKPVLLVDLDYQGSLSNMLMLAIEREEVESHIDWLLDENANLATIDRAAIHLVSCCRFHGHLV